MLRLIGFAVVLSLPSVARGQNQQRLKAVRIPEPVSGRSLAEPQTLTLADVQARVLLVQDHLNLVLTYMGRSAPPPLLVVEKASVRSAFGPAVNLFRRAQTLGFDVLRAPERPIVQPPVVISPGVLMRKINQTLEVVLQVERHLGIPADQISEKAQPESTRPEDVVNALIRVGGSLNASLEARTTPSQAYQALTLSLSMATRLHVAKTRRFLPREPAFEPNKTNAVVYQSVEKTLRTLLALCVDQGLPELAFRVDESRVKGATSDDVVDLVALMLAEMSRLYQALVKDLPRFGAIEMGLRYPSHNYQRARHLEAVLVSLSESLGRKAR